MQKMKILTICPSIRNNRLMKMMDSFLKTKKYSDLIINTTPGSITKIFNDTFNQYKNYDYYHLTNDDFVYRTNGWDEILANNAVNGISYGSDLLANESIPTAPMVSGNIARRLGWIQMPTLTHLYGDVVWRDIGKAIGKYTYCKDVIIEHEHFMNNKVEKCDVYKKTNSFDMYQSDQDQYILWRRDKLQEDIKTIIGDVSRKTK